jgi:DNA (cytosine-5)-methyltransferase 1
MKSISLFTGAGGLDLGLEAAGFEPAICVESDEDARATLRLNRKHWLLLEPGDIHSHRPEEIMEQARLRPREAVLMSGGPPCQPFSKASFWVNGKAAGLADSRSKTLKAYIDVAEVALPQVLLLENVRGLSGTGKNSALELLESWIDRINRRHRTRYRWTIVYLNAADFGVPQTRERLYLVADRDGRIFVPPCKTHSPVANDDHLEEYLTAWDAIGELDTDTWDETLTPRGKWARLLPSIPEGWNYLWHTDRGKGVPLFGWRTRFWSFLLKLAKSRPSWTLPAYPGPATGPFHWRSRLLSRKELLRLQTFPDDYAIQGARASAQRQIGNAVPPLIGEVIGKEICRQWLGLHKKGNLLFLPSHREDQPGPSPVRPLPKQYLSLVGTHKSHPGVGKGPRARALKRERERELGRRIRDARTKS